MGSEKAEGWRHHDQRVSFEAYESVSSFVLLLSVLSLNGAPRLQKPPGPDLPCMSAVAEGLRQRPGPQLGLFLVCWYQWANRQSSLGETCQIILV